MKVFKFNSEGYTYAVAALTKIAATAHIIDSGCVTKLDSVEEIPESEWDKKTITTYEDNDSENEPSLISIRDVICGEEPQLVYTNDHSIID